jgi:hypothetical protein
MVLDQRDTNFGGYRDGEFIILQRQFGEKVEIHPMSKFLPEHVPGAKQHIEYAEQLTKEYDAFGKTGGKLPTRQEAEEAIKVTATYFCIIAWATKNPGVLENLGLELKTRTYTRHNEGVPAAPKQITIKNEGKKVFITIPGMPRNSHIELQINESDPTDESAWRLFEILFTGSRACK